MKHASSSSVDEALAYKFTSSALLQRALTHRSYSADHNERLEFVGDGVLNCAIAAELYRAFPDLSEGELSRLRATLVNRETLHAVALELGLGGRLKLGEGELRSGGHERPSILADAVEALIGAVFLDGGFEAARNLVLRCWASRIAAIDPRRSLKDAKTRLQEVLQANRQPLPSYSVEAIDGEAHNQTFTVRCEIVAPSISCLGKGSSRRLAEQQAAEAVLAVIERKA